MSEELGEATFEVELSERAWDRRKVGAAELEPIDRALKALLEAGASYERIARAGPPLVRVRVPAALRGHPQLRGVFGKRITVERPGAFGALKTSHSSALRATNAGPRVLQDPKRNPGR